MEQKPGDLNRMTGVEQATFGPGAQVAPIECDMLDENAPLWIIVADTPSIASRMTWR